MSRTPKPPKTDLRRRLSHHPPQSGSSVRFPLQHTKNEMNPRHASWRHHSRYSKVAWRSGIAGAPPVWPKVTYRWQILRSTDFTEAHLGFATFDQADMTFANQRFHTLRSPSFRS